MLTSTSNGLDDGDMMVVSFICTMLFFSTEMERLPISSRASLQSEGLAVVKKVTGYASDPTGI